MSNMVNIKINGNEYSVPEGMNLIDAADSVGIHIPNLCYLKGMKGIGACRMCLVESSGRTMTGCIMKTKDGMDIVTDSERIKELRKFVIDLILSMHPLDCMTCTKAGVCDLQQYAYDFEVKESTYTRKSFDFPTDEENPFIKRDPDYCVLCGRCVRVCREQSTSVLDFMGRGVGSKVTTANDKPLKDSGCTFCGSCVDVCPVNALLEADRWRKGREWEYENHKSVCLHCGNACEISVSTWQGDVAKIRAGAEKGRADHYICALGRYGFDSLKAETRVLAPMKKVNGKLEETTWDDALAMAAEKIKSGDAGIVSTGSITNEEAYALKQLADKAGVSNIDTTVSLYGDASTIIGSKADLDDADLIVIVGLNPSQWTRDLPALDAIVRKKAARKTGLVVLNSKEVSHSEIAAITIGGDETGSLKSLAKAIVDKGGSAPAGVDLSSAETSEDMEKAAELFIKAENPVIITSPSLFEAAQNLALIDGKCKVLSASPEANARGVLLMGLAGSGKSYQEMTNGGGVKVLYAVGDVPVDKRPGVDFLVVQNSQMTDLAKEADLVLPAAPILEAEGSVVDYQGILKSFQKSTEPLGDAKGGAEIVTEVAAKMSVELSKLDASEIEKLAEKELEPSAKAFAKRDGLNEDCSQLLDSMNRCVVNGSRLLWLKETEKAVAV